MILVTRFQPDLAKMPSLIAVLWQGDAPAVTVRNWVYLDGEPFTILCVWEAPSEAARAWLEDRLTPFGEVETLTGSDGTAGMTAVIERDLVGMAAFLKARGGTDEHVDPQIQLRRRGMMASSVEQAMGEARSWTVEQQGRHADGRELDA